MATQKYDFMSKNTITSKPNGTGTLWKKYLMFFY